MARKLNCVDKYNISWDAFALFFSFFGPFIFAARIYCEVPHKGKEGGVCDDFACLLWTFTMMRIKFAGK